MEYLNFELKIGTINDDKYPVQVLNSPAGEVSSMVDLPFRRSEFQDRLDLVERSRKTDETRKSIKTDTETTRDTFRLSTLKKEETVKELGIDLFESLFTPEIRSCFRSSLQQAREDKKGLRIRLRIEAPDLAGIPWEFLYDEKEGDYFCLNTETPLVRFLELGRPPEALTVTPPLHILGVIASPVNLPKLNIEKEKAQMMAGLESLLEKGFVKMTWLEGESWRDLQAAMRKGPWHILHFIGHGGFNEQTGEGAIALVGDDGNSELLDATNFGRLLSGHQSMRMVILNACEGARTSDKDLFSSVGANLIRKGIPAVVSMQYEITDRAAIEFSRTFYETIAEGIPVDAALQESRKAISFAQNDSFEWGTPVLHMRAPDGMLFEMNVAGAIFPKKEEGEVKKTINIQPLTIEEATSSAIQMEERSGLQILMHKVRNFWVKGVLEQSLQHSALLELGLTQMPGMVDSPFGSTPISPDQSLGEVFNEIGRSLLILGEPGSGKTTMLLTLAKELIIQYKNAPGFPLPVIFNLSSWTQTTNDLPGWLADELSTKYLIPRKIGASWVDQNRILLMLDGLDEVGTERRNACVQAINTYLSRSAILGIVVCCRFKEYLDLGSKLNLNGAIRLKVLSREKILQTVGDAGAAYSGLLELLKNDSSFLKLAEIPFMLNLMMQTYKGISAEQFSVEKMESMQSKRMQLMQAYVQRQFRMVETGVQV